MSVTILNDSNRHQWCEFGYVLYYKTVKSIQDEETALLSGVDPDTFTVENLIDTVIQSQGRHGQTAQIYTDDGKALTNDPWFNTWSLAKRGIESESLLFVVLTPHRTVHFKNKSKLSYTTGKHILNVHVMMDKTYPVRVDLTRDDIGSLKSKIYDVTAIPTSCQKLSIGGQNTTPLNNDLDENSTVMVALGSEFGEIYSSKSENFKADIQPCVTQTRPGLAMFYSALFVVAEHVEDYTNTSVDGTLSLIRKLTGFPPLVISLGTLFDGRSITFVEKVAIVEGLYQLFRRMLPSCQGAGISNIETVPDNRVFEYSGMCWAHIMKLAKDADNENEDYKYIDLTCPISGERLMEPVRIHGNDEDVFEKEVVHKKSEEEEPIGGKLVQLYDVIEATDIKLLLLCQPYSQTTFMEWQKPEDYWPREADIQPVNIGDVESWMLSDEEYLKIYPTLSLKKPDTHGKLPCMTISDGTEKYPVVCTGVVKKAVPTEVYYYDSFNNREVRVQPDRAMLSLKTYPFSETRIVAKKKTSGGFTREPEEAIIVLFDISGSMTGSCLGGDLSKIDAIKQFFHAFANRSMAYNFTHVVGLTTFESSVTVVEHCTEAFESFKMKIDSLVTLGSTALYDAIDNGVSQLDELANTYQDCKKRILCMTDGGENGSCTEITSVARRLKASNVFLDSILVGTENDQLKCLSIISGGCCFHPDTLVEGIQLFESETLLSIRMRQNVVKPFHGINSEADILQYRFMGYTTKADHQLPKALEERTIPDHILLNREARKQPKGGRTVAQLREKRILREMSIYHKNPHANIQIFPSEHNVGFWRILMVGPADTPYEDGVFSLYAEFPVNYPVAPPEIRFITPIYHCNVNETGRICHSIFDREYTSNTSVTTMLIMVFGLLMAPEPKDPLNSAVAEEYFNDQSVYLSKARDHTRCNANTTLHDHMDMLATSAKTAAPPPPELVCPLTKALYVDPVVTPCGDVYERYAIESMLKRKDDDPRTRGLDRSQLKPDIDKLREVEHYRRERIVGDKWWQS